MPLCPCGLFSSHVCRAEHQSSCDKLFHEDFWRPKPRRPFLDFKIVYRHNVHMKRLELTETSLKLQVCKGGVLLNLEYDLLLFRNILGSLLGRRGLSHRRLAGLGPTMTTTNIRLYDIQPDGEPIGRALPCHCRYHNSKKLRSAAQKKA